LGKTLQSGTFATKGLHHSAYAPTAPAPAGWQRLFVVVSARDAETGHPIEVARNTQMTGSLLFFEKIKYRIRSVVVEEQGKMPTSQIN
jgi:hypothetical protein